MKDIKICHYPNIIILEQDSLAYNLSYAALMTYVPILGGEQFELVSAQPNFQPKKKGIVMDFKFVLSIVTCYFVMMLATSLKYTQRQLCV